MRLIKFYVIFKANILKAVKLLNTFDSNKNFDKLF